MEGLEQKSICLTSLCCQLLGLLNHISNISLHVESSLRKIVIFSRKDLLEALKEK